MYTITRANGTCKVGAIGSFKPSARPSWLNRSPEFICKCTLKFEFEEDKLSFEDGKSAPVFPHDGTHARYADGNGLSIGFVLLPCN